MRVIVGMMMVGLAVVGCSNQAEQASAQPAESTPAAKPEVTPVPASTGEHYTVITTGTAAPFSMKDAQGALSGIDIEIIKAIAESEGFSVSFFEKPWQEVLPSLEKGDYDIAVNGINYSDERNSKYGLTTAYFYNPSAFMYKNNSKAKPTTLSELSGLTVGVMQDSKQDLEASAVSGTTVVRQENLYTAYKALVQGTVDVVAYDMAVMQHLAKEHKDTSVTITPYEDKSDKATYNVFIVKQDNQELLGKLNAGLEKIKANGKLDAISKAYVGE